MPYLSYCDGFTCLRIFSLFNSLLDVNCHSFIVETVSVGGSSRESVKASKESRAQQAPQSTAPKSRVDNVQLKGKNTFAAPRNVRALNLASKSKTNEKQDENPKSNDEFRKMFIKS